MSFISYAQNNEDVLLWRALGHVAASEGFYIDVGASDPVEHSVTRAFYDAGWRGINIEPLPAHIAAFDAQRPRDINLAVAAGGADGSLVLYDVPAVRGWASPDPAVAAMHRAEGHAVAELTVPVRTLASICNQYVAGPLHFLKIDVEGFEGEVLRGMDFERWRPWVLVIEATLPNSRVTSHDSWEALVTDRGYRFAWFDGLNRYYVAREQAALLRHFEVQPNVFDDYLSHHLVRAWAAHRHGEAALAAGDARLRDVQGRLDEAVARLDMLAQEKLAAQTDALRARTETVQAQADAERARADTAQAQLDAAHARRQAASTRAAAAAARIEAGAARQAAVQAQAATARARVDARAARADATAAQAGAAEARAAAVSACTEAAKARSDTTRARAALARAHADITAAQAEVARLHGEYDQAVVHGRQAADWARDLERRLLATLASTSWRVTQPLRDAGAVVQRLRRPGLAHRALARALSPALAPLLVSERMRRTFIPLLLRHPALGRRVSGVLHAVRQAPPAAAAVAAADAVPDDLRHLPASVRAVLLDLRRARAGDQGDDDRCAS